MKTSSKIAIAAAAIGAWLIAKKKGVACIGAVRKKKYKFLYRVTDGSQMLANALRYTTEPKIVFNYQNSDPIEFEFGHFGIPRSAIEVERSFGKYFKPIDFAGVDVYERVSGTGKVLESGYDGARVTTTDGRHAVSFDIHYPNHEPRFIVTAETWTSENDKDYMGDWEYWATIGRHYTSLQGAWRAAKKWMADRGYELDSKDYSKI